MENAPNNLVSVGEIYLSLAELGELPALAAPPQNWVPGQRWRCSVSVPGTKGLMVDWYVGEYDEPYAPVEGKPLPDIIWHKVYLRGSWNDGADNPTG